MNSSFATSRKPRQHIRLTWTLAGNAGSISESLRIGRWSRCCRIHLKFLETPLAGSSRELGCWKFPIEVMHDFEP